MDIQKETILFFLRLKLHLENRLNFFCELYSMKTSIENIVNLNYTEDIKEQIKEIYAEYNTLNNEVYLQREISKTKELICNIEDKIYAVCEHVFVEDFIDTAFEESKKIKYCNNCSLNYRDKYYHVFEKNK